MNNAIYAAATGMLTGNRAMNMISNNLSNSSTSGFKKDKLLTADFGSFLTYNINDAVKEIGTTNHGIRSAGTFTDYEQGTLSETGNSLDFAILGNGFFTLTQPNGTTALTRDGQFNIDRNGFLVNSAGAFVMGEKGKLQVGMTGFRINNDGEIFVNDELVDKLMITNPANTNLRKLSNGMISNSANRTAFTGSIIQGAIENSNVEVSEEMVDMIAKSRAFQACSQIIKQMDRIMQKTVNEIGRL